MVARGEVAVAGRKGNDRLWDLASRVDPVVPADEALQLRNVRRLRALGIARAHAQKVPVEPMDVGDAGEHDRKRTVDIFDFDYQLEMYKPAAKRRWGYYALPVLYGDRLVGKVDATADRKAGVLRVDAIHSDVAFTKPMAADVRREITDLARWLDLDLNLQSRA